MQAYGKCRYELLIRGLKLGKLSKIKICSPQEPDVKWLQFLMCSHIEVIGPISGVPKLDLVYKVEHNKQKDFF